MAFTRTYITMQGLALLTKLETKKEKLVITGVVGSSNPDKGVPPIDMVQIDTPAITFQVIGAVEYVAPKKLRVPLYYENSAQAQDIQLTEIGVYAEDPDGTTVLLAVSVSYDQAVPISSAANGRLELTIDFLIEFSLAEDITIEVPSSLIYLTKPEAEKLFWIIGVKYPATEITETTGTTTEEWQRIQDDRIAQILTMLESGSTAGTIYDRPTLFTVPDNWKILNNSGYRNLFRGTIEA